MTLILEFHANILTFFAAILAVFGRDNLWYSTQPAAVGLGLNLDFVVAAKNKFPF
jgi:hypothetical protein